MNITIGQVLAGLGIIAGGITSITVIVALFTKWYSKTVLKNIKEAVEPVNENISNMKKEFLCELDNTKQELKAMIDNGDSETCRNYLVHFLSDISKGNDIDPVEIEHAFAVMKHYSEDLKQNSYIHARWVQVLGDMSMSDVIKKYSIKSGNNNKQRRNK